MLEEASRLTPEKQKQLDGIKEIYSEQQEIFNTTLTDILRKYKADFTKKDQETLFLVVETSTSEDEFKNKLKEELSMSFLKSDIRTIFNSKEDLREEKELELTRLEIFEDNNKKDI